MSLAVGDLDDGGITTPAWSAAERSLPIRRAAEHTFSGFLYPQFSHPGQFGSSPIYSRVAIIIRYARNSPTGCDALTDGLSPHEQHLWVVLYSTR